MHNVVGHNSKNEGPFLALPGHLNRSLIIGFAIFLFEVNQALSVILRVFNTPNPRFIDIDSWVYISFLSFASWLAFNLHNDVLLPFWDHLDLGIWAFFRILTYLTNKRDIWLNLYFLRWLWIIFRWIFLRILTLRLHLSIHSFKILEILLGCLLLNRW